MSARDIDRDLTRGSMRAHVRIGEEEEEEEVRFIRTKDYLDSREAGGFVGWKGRIFPCRLVVLFVTNVVSFNEARFKDYEEKEGNLWTVRVRRGRVRRGASDSGNLCGS